MTDSGTGREGDWSPYVRCVKELISAAQAADRLDSAPSDVAIGDALDQLGCVGSEAALIEPLRSSIELTQRIIDAISNQARLPSGEQTGGRDDLTIAEFRVIFRALRYLAANDFNRISNVRGADPEDIARQGRHRAEVEALAGKIFRLCLTAPEEVDSGVPDLLREREMVERLRMVEFDTDRGQDLTGHL